MRYIVIMAELVGGNESPIRIEHYWDGREFGAQQDAVSHGFKQRGSDDFNIGLVASPRPGGRESRLHSIWWMDENLHEPPETLREIAQEIGLR
jgi:hypothetical protein